MFTFTPNPTFSWPVRILVPVPNGRKEVREALGLFRVVSSERLGELNDQAGNPDKTILKEVLAGWNKIEDEQGSPLVFSDETRDALLAIPYVRAAFIRAYFQAINGEAAEKN
ncbi:MAG: hypothetical protein HQL34_11535 [Alphaproteobacteria bacterium]|nr:hypothetical protein [Alphaproteobacteria bacterium]